MPTVQVQGRVRVWDFAVNPKCVFAVYKDDNKATTKTIIGREKLYSIISYQNLPNQAVEGDTVELCVHVKCIPDCDQDLNGKKWPADQQVTPTDDPVRFLNPLIIARPRCTDAPLHPQGGPTEGDRISPPVNLNTDETKPPGVVQDPDGPPGGGGDN